MINKVKRKQKRIIASTLCLFTLISNFIFKPKVASAATLYDRKEDVPLTDTYGNPLICIEEDIDYSDVENIDVMINHTFKYNETVNHLITKKLNPNFHEPETPTNLKWNTVVYAYDGKGGSIDSYKGRPLNYNTDIWIFDYKVEMAVMSSSGNVKLTDGDIMMNGKAITPYLLNGCIPNQNAYIQGSTAITSAWENPCWNSNKPRTFRANSFSAPNMVSKGDNKYKKISDQRILTDGEIYLPNKGNNYTLPNTFNTNKGIYPNYVGYYNHSQSPDSQVQKGQYANTTYKMQYGRVRYRGVYQNGTPSTPSTGGGQITFTPYETDWTNQGKIAEGRGSYPVQVEYVGDNPVTAQGVATIHHDEPVPPITNPNGTTSPQPNKVYDYTVNFDVKYYLQSITVTGATNETVSGTSGVVHITKEGENLQLSGVGTWKEPVFTLPTPGPYESVTSTQMPTTPGQPTGNSGYYNLDWTKAQIDYQSATNRWINSPVKYPVAISVSDNLSGFANGDQVTVSDYSHYGNNATDSLPYAGKSYNRTVSLDDGMYNISVNAKDRAGNESTRSSERYLIDGTDPVVNFNVTPKIFNESNGAVRKQSVRGTNFAYFGTLTASDNLSGVNKIQYKWTYGNSKPSSGYEVIYTSPYTYTDRYSESINKEIEKPVGDDLYLHVEIWDTAGNYKYRSFGPYEDPIKLKDFQVTDIRDPRWKDVFWNDDDYKDYTGKTYKVNQLPVDDKSHPTLKNAFPKKGYSFYFDLTSEFLYRQEDRIEITPNFYYLKDNGERVRADCYYNNNNNPLVKFGSDKDDSTINLDTAKYGKVLIGNYNKLILTRGVRTVKGREWINGWKNEIQYTDGKEQWWYGKYFIPSSTFFVKAGDSPRPENKLIGGKILINFTITAYKNGEETYSTDQIFCYNTNQWGAEGGPKNSDYKIGDVIIYNAHYGATSDNTLKVVQ